MRTLDGSVISHCEWRHWNGERLALLEQIACETPKDNSLQLICDDYATRKYAVVKA